MKRISVLHAQLALAAYASLEKGILSIDRLQEKQVSLAEAMDLASSWVVADQYSHWSGLDVTVFKSDSGERVLAVRGTAGFKDLFTDFWDVALIGTFRSQMQFKALRAKVSEWMSDGTLGPSFTVTGHSLGGFLAAGVMSAFPENVTGAYLFNSPGMGGVWSSSESTENGFVPYGGINPLRVSNVRADAGISPVSALGVPVSKPISIYVENQIDLNLLSDLQASLNHSQRVLIDSVALYSLFSKVDPVRSMEEVGVILRRASARNADSLESALDLLGRAVGLHFNTPVNDREEYFKNIAATEAAIFAEQGAFQIRLLDDASSILAAARRDSSEGLAYRFALRGLDPIAVLRPINTYDVGVLGALELFDPLTGQGSITSDWLIDRARMLVTKNVLFERDDLDVKGVLGEFRDLGNSRSAEDLILPGMTSSDADGPLRIVFGSLVGETLVSGAQGGHLYGDAGDDLLYAGAGSDYMEGGLGFDRYYLTSAQGIEKRDVLLDVDGIGEIVLDEVKLTGGSWRGGNRFESEDGRIHYTLIQDPTGDATLLIGDQVEISHFHNGSLGLFFDEPNVGVMTGVGYEYHYQGDGYPVDGPQDDSAFDMGSDFGDEYESGRWNAAGEFVAGAASGAFFGKGGNDLYLGSYKFGSDYADGGSGDDILDSGALGVREQSESQVGDMLIGGAGRDRLSGSYLDDRLIGDFDASMGVWVGGSDLRILQIGFDSATIRYDEGTASFMFIDDRARGYGAHVRHFGQLADAVRFALGIQSPEDAESAYDDLIVAGAGNDFVVGGNGSDTLFGDEGDDEIIGDNEAFFYRQVAGLNHENSGLGEYLPLVGLPGDDFLDGGDGNDRLIDLVYGSDTMYGGEGDDLLNDLDWFDAEQKLGFKMQFLPTHNVLDGGAGNDIIYSSMPDGLAGSSDIDGGEGDDDIRFWGWSGTVEGGPGNDTIEVLAQIAWIDGGEGDDVISVISARSLYVATGQGRDSITLSAIEDGAIDFTNQVEDSALELSLDGWDARDVFVSRVGNDLVLENPLMSATLDLLDWYGGESRPAVSLSFGDLVLTAVQIEASIGHGLMLRSDGELLFSSTDRPVVAAGNGNDILVGSAPAVLAGGVGNDVIIARLGGLLAGGPGNDEIEADQPSLIVFNRGDGVDEVSIDSGTISLGGGIQAGDLRIVSGEDSVTLDFGAGDALVLYRQSPPDGDGQADIFADVRLQFVMDDHVVLRSLGGLDAADASLRDKAVGGDVLVGLGRGESAWLAEGMSAIEWPGYATALRDIFVDQPPIMTAAPAPVSLHAGATFDIALPASSFADPDGDALYFTVGPDVEAEWPEWLGYDADTWTLHAAPPAGVAGEFQLRVYAVDGHGLWTQGDLLIEVASGSEVEQAAGDSGLHLPDSGPDDTSPPDDQPPELAGNEGESASGSAEGGPDAGGDVAMPPVADDPANDVDVSAAGEGNAGAVNDEDLAESGDGAEQVVTIPGLDGASGIDPDTSAGASSGADTDDALPSTGEDGEQAGLPTDVHAGQPDALPMDSGPADGTTDPIPVSGEPTQAADSMQADAGSAGEDPQSALQGEYIQSGGGSQPVAGDPPQAGPIDLLGEDVNRSGTGAGVQVPDSHSGDDPGSADAAVDGVTVAGPVQGEVDLSGGTVVPSVEGDQAHALADIELEVDVEQSPAPAEAPSTANAGGSAVSSPPVASLADPVVEVATPSPLPAAGDSGTSVDAVPPSDRDIAAVDPVSSVGMVGAVRSGEDGQSHAGADTALDVDAVQPSVLAGTPSTADAGESAISPSSSPVPSSGDPVFLVVAPSTLPTATDAGTSVDAVPSGEQISAADIGSPEGMDVAGRSDGADQPMSIAQDEDAPEMELPHASAGQEPNLHDPRPGESAQSTVTGDMAGNPNVGADTSFDPVTDLPGEVNEGAILALSEPGDGKPGEPTAIGTSQPSGDGLMQDLAGNAEGPLPSESGRAVPVESAIEADARGEPVGPAAGAEAPEIIAEKVPGQQVATVAEPEGESGSPAAASGNGGGEEGTSAADAGGTAGTVAAGQQSDANDVLAPRPSTVESSKAAETPPERIETVADTAQGDGTVDAGNGSNPGFAGYLPASMTGAWAEQGMLQTYATGSGVASSSASALIGNSSSAGPTAQAGRTSSNGFQPNGSDAAAGSEALGDQSEATPLSFVWESSASESRSNEEIAPGISSVSDWVPPPMPSSWDLTQALLDFHLSDTRHASLGDEPVSPGSYATAEPGRFAGMLAGDQLSGYASMPNLQVFSGLRDGMTFLGRL